MHTKPVSVSIVSWLFIAAGALAFIFHLPHSLAAPGGGAGVEAVEILAIVAGVFMLRGQDWARWLALAWMGFHVAISARGELPRLAAHAVIFAAIAWILWRPAAGRYFRGRRGDAGAGAP